MTFRVDQSSLSSKIKAQWAGHPKLATGLLLCAGFALTALIVRGTEPSSEATVTPAAIPQLVDADLFAEIDAVESVTGKQIELTLKPGDSLGPLLQKNGVTPQRAYQITESFAQVYNPRHLRAGQSLTVSFDKAETPDVVSVTMKPSFDRTLIVTRDGDEFTPRDYSVTFPSEIVEVSGTIENSLYLDAGRLGAPDKVIVQFSQIYEHSVDFQRDIQPGDNFVLTFQLYRDAKGNPVKAGDLIYTSFTPRGQEMSYYLYTNKKGEENFYDEDGKSAKRKLMRTPINGARLSSGYGKRRHPVLGYVKTHKGVDFAAPTGTPIMAAGVGTVEYSGRNGSFGKYIRIRHSDGYKTAYAHMSRLAVRKGSRVRQGQTIGYVGTTGRSTGPHLHYEVHKNGRAINPRSLSTLSGKPLPAGEKDAFNARKTEIELLRAAAGPALRPAKDPVILVSADGKVPAP